ncbi:Origin recognition complex subunit 3 [Coemansia sp. RSA 988]|nr:Origin recognition complex subunit 3 [Coemansia sp. RSA 988]
MTDTYSPVDVFDSMTESTFILKPKTQRKKTGNGRTGKAADSNAVSTNDGYVRLLQGREPLESMELRKSLFKELWNPLEKLLIDTEKQVNNIGITEVCNFVDTSYVQSDSQEKGRLAQPFAEIAAAVAFAGVNTGDHGKLFQSLQEQLCERGHHVALLESQYCNSLPNMHKCILEQICGGSCANVEGSGEEEQSLLSGTKAIPYDLNLLKLWWATVVESASNKSKRAVIILQDLEGFSPMVVDDFIRIATSYSEDVPIVIVLGLGTSYECVQQSLTKASMSMLNVERFNLQRSRQCIDAVIRQLFVRGEAVLSFGTEAYKSLLDQFLLYNFSISGFVKKLKYAAMDFFYAQPLSIVASIVARSANGTCPIRLTSDQIELIRMQRSVQRALEREAEKGTGRAHVHKALTNDAFFQDVVLPQLVRQLTAYRQGYCVGIGLVEAIQSMAPDAAQKPIRTLHYYGLGLQFDECPHWKTLAAVVRRMNIPDMEILLDKLLRVVEQMPDVDWSLVSEDNVQVPELLQQASTLLARPDSLSKEEEPSSEEPKRRIRTRTDTDYRSFMMFHSDASDAELCALERCCKAVDKALRTCLTPYQNVPLNEIFYYRHSHLLDTAFSAQPRAAVQTALGKSHYYLNCDCCDPADDSIVDGSDSSEDQRILPTMHDSSISYRLHQECGRMINLFDWYSSFASVVEKESPSSHTNSAPSQAEVQARFMRTVEELQFLGFVKPTQRKTDHVLRLTWGA